MDISLESKFVLYRGFEGTTGPQYLRGHIVFQTEATLKPRCIEISLHRIQRTEHHVLSYERMAGYTRNGNRIINKYLDDLAQQRVKNESGDDITKVPAGESKYVFSMELDKDLLESVEGEPDDKQYRKYELRVSLETSNLKSLHRKALYQYTVGEC